MPTYPLNGLDARTNGIVAVPDGELVRLTPVDEKVRTMYACATV